MSDAATPPATIRVLLADDHPVVRDGLRAMLAGSEVEIAGEASSGPDAVAVAAEVQPDIVLMDVRMPGGDGLRATRDLQDAAPGSRVLILTSFEDDDYLRSAIEAGAAGFLLKGSSRALLLESIRAVHAGGSTYPPAMLAELLGRRDTHAPPQAEPEADPPPRATGGDGDVIHLGSLTIDAGRHLVLVDSAPVMLTFMEFRALWLLARSAGEVVSHERLLTELWPDEATDAGDAHRVVSLIARIRSRLGDPARRYVQTIKRVGYRLAPPA